MSAVTKSTHSYTAQRVTLHSPLPIDEVLKRLDAEIKKDINIRATQVDDPKKFGKPTAEEFERGINERVGEKGFMFFGAFSHSEWFTLFASSPPPKTYTYVLGNPLIARTMMKHDIRAGLCVPLRVLVKEAEGREGTEVVYDLPSSIIAVGQAGEHEEALKKAAEALDAKAENMLKAVLGDE